jgi:serine-type D-Ala-D-Ala carboxypeptidase (penicillin-binding protein 5/6)
VGGRRATPLAAVLGLILSILRLVPAGPAVAQSPPPPSPDVSPPPTALQTPGDPTRPPRLDVPAFLLMDRRGQVLRARAANDPRPVASLTKLMTAYLVGRAVVDRQARWNEPVTVSATADARLGSTAELETGERVRLRNLLTAMLVTSANDAAFAIAEHLGGSVEGFVDEMNRTAAALGLDGTVFTSPDGFDDTGTSTAGDVATLWLALIGGDLPANAVAPIRDAVVARTFQLDEDRVFQNRNAMLWLYPGATGVKTGFTFGAGYCLLAVAERDGREVLAVVLGDDDEPFSDAAALLDFGIDGFEERRLVARGEEVDSVTVRGRLHPVVAAKGATRLVPVGVEVERSIRVRRAAGLEVGDRVGTLVYRIPSGPIAIVALLVGERATQEPNGPPSPREDAWWALLVAGGLLAGFLLLLIVLAAVRRRFERRRAAGATRGWTP